MFEIGVCAALMVILAAAAAEAKTLRWANDGDANSMDPYARQETFLLLMDMSFYEPLIRRSREMKLEPGLATQWTRIEPITVGAIAGLGCNSTEQAGKR